MNHFLRTDTCILHIPIHAGTHLNRILNEHQGNSLGTQIKKIQIYVAYTTLIKTLREHTIQALKTYSPTSLSPVSISSSPSVKMDYALGINEGCVMRQKNACLIC